MKILTAVDSIFTLFPQKVNISLVHAISGNPITYDIKEIALPESFDRPTIITISNAKWRVMKADIKDSTSYFSRKKIILHIVELEDPLSKIKHSVPSQASYPPLTSTPGIDMLTCNPDNWLQLSFYSIQSLPLLQEMAEKVLTIIEAGAANALNGYDNILVREELGENNLGIDFNDFRGFLNNPSQGNIQWENSSYVENGFSLSTESYLYYGTIDEANKIKQLAIQQLEYVSDELTDILAKYELALVDWCNGSIIS